jgi:methylase of polypeptide subunit release factors
MMEANLLFKGGELFRSKIRISSLGGDLFIHSHFPTNDVQAVFFGPDTYRFARFISQSLLLSQFQSAFRNPLRVLDVGSGSGAGGIAAIRSLPKKQSYKLYLNDLNPVALAYAQVCARVAEIPVTTVCGNFFDIKNAEFDLIISNPPYLSDPAARLYRDGGSHMGLELSLRIVKHALDLLAPGGRLLLYTGVAMKNDGNNPVLSELITHLSSDKFSWSYEEIDPDIFGEELEKPEYKGATRIAAIGLTVLRVY